MPIRFLRASKNRIAYGISNLWAKTAKITKNDAKRPISRGTFGKEGHDTVALIYRRVKFALPVYWHTGLKK